MNSAICNYDIVVSAFTCRDLRKYMAPAPQMLTPTADDLDIGKYLYMLTLVAANIEWPMCLNSTMSRDPMASINVLLVVKRTEVSIQNIALCSRSISWRTMIDTFIVMPREQCSIAWACTRQAYNSSQLWTVWTMYFIKRQSTLALFAKLQITHLTWSSSSFCLLSWIFCSLFWDSFRA